MNTLTVTIDERYTTIDPVKCRPWVSNCMYARAVQDALPGRRIAVANREIQIDSTVLRGPQKMHDNVLDWESGKRVPDHTITLDFVRKEVRL